MEALQPTIEFAKTLSWPVIAAIGTAFVFLVIGLRLILKKPPSHLTAYSGESGSVLVSRKALQDLIKQACMLEDWVESARPLVRVEKHKVSAQIELRLANPENMKDVCNRVQERVTTLLQKSLSFDQIGSIRILVKSFKSSENRETSLQQAPSLPAAPRNVDEPGKE